MRYSLVYMLSFNTVTCIYGKFVLAFAFGTSAPIPPPCPTALSPKKRKLKREKYERNCTKKSWKGEGRQFCRFLVLFSWF